MNKFFASIRPAALWVWRRTAAAIALLLIVLALIVGYLVGRPDAEPDAGAAELSAAVAGGEPQMYTCSMHPSVRLPDPDAKCPICFMDLIPVTNSGAGGGDEPRLALSAGAAARARIETAEVARFFPAAEVRLLGKITYDQTSVARLTAWFPGRIERLFVNYIGVPVARGDHLAELYSPDLLAAFEELRQGGLAAEQAGSMTDLMRRTAQDTLEATREKLRLYGLSPQQIQAIEEGRYDSDRLTIYAPIGGVVTDLAAREGDYLNMGEPIATVADLSRLWLDLEAYESQLPLLRWGQPVTFTVEAHPGEIFEGRISFIEPIVDDRTRTAAVRVAVDNSERRLKPGMFATAVVRPRLGAGGAVISDELAGKWVSPMHPTIVKDEPGQCDICGMDLVPAESLGVVGDPAEATPPLVVPRSAVLFTGTRSVVYVQDPEAERPTYEPREVTLGPRAGEYYIVRDGLSEGESVVVGGAFRIDSAMQIAGKPSMMSPDGGGAMPGHRHGASAAAAAGAPSVPDTFAAGLSPVYEGYLAAQEALADDDLPAFNAAAASLRDAVEGVATAGLHGETLGAWRRAAAELTVDPFEDIEAARARFEPMSEAIVAVHRRFGRRGEEPLHIAHCPMAFDFEGADWLQRGETINNPYFGASMLRCGTLTEELPPTAPGQAPTAPPPAPADHEPEVHEPAGSEPQEHDHG